MAAGNAGCGLFDPGCWAQGWVESALGDAIENLARAVLEAFGKAVASLGTLWVNVGTPNLTGTGGSSSIAAGSSAPNSEGIVQVLGWVTWIAIVFAAISIILLGILVATRMRAGEGFRAVGPLGFVLGGIFLMSGATALVSGLLPRGPQGAGGAVLFLQSSLWWYMGAAAVVSVIIGGIRMVWEQRAEPGKETIKSLLTLIVVAGSGVTIVGLLVSAFDSFSVWILNGALSCDVGADSACFGENIANLLALTTNPNTGGLGALLVIILGIIAILATAAQIVLMIARGGMLVILTGILPLSASATNTEMGKGWFKKNVGWLVAFILYKPAAAIVYAAAFQLVGTNIFQDDGTGFIAVLTGLILMVLALFAMPALMRFVTPLVSSLSAGAGGALGAAAVMALLRARLLLVASRPARVAVRRRRVARARRAVRGRPAQVVRLARTVAGAQPLRPHRPRAPLVAVGAARQGPRRPRVPLVAARALLRRLLAGEPLRVVQLPRVVVLLPVAALRAELLPALRAARLAWPRASRSALRLRVCKRPRERRRT